MSWNRFPRLFLTLILTSSFLMSVTVIGQPQKEPAPLESPPSAAVALQSRLEAARAAQSSGDPPGVADANRRLAALALRQMANLRVLQAAWPQAVELYQRSIDLEDIPDTHVDLAIAYMRALRADDTLSETAKAILTDPGNARAWHVQGKAWMMKNDDLKAVESLTQSITLQGDLDAAYSLGICLLHTKQKEKAAALFQEMLTVGGDRAVLHVLFGRAYRDTEMLDDAEREFKRAIELDPKTAHAHYFLGLAYLIRAEWGRSPEARKEFQSEIEFNPRDFFSNYFLGVMDSGEKEYARSDKYLRIASEVNPNWPEAWLYLGLNAFERGEFSVAEEHLRKAIALTGKQEDRNNYQIRRAYYALARILARAGKKEESAATLRTYSSMEEKARASGRAKLDSIQAGMGSERVMDIEVEHSADANLVRAGSVLDSTAQLTPELLARVNMSDEEMQQAKLQEAQLRSILGSALNDLATAEARQQRYEIALAHFHEAARWQPETPGLARNTGIAAAKLEKYPEAAQTLRDVVASNPDDDLARSLLGVALYSTEAYADAVATLQPMETQLRADSALSYIYGAALLKANQTVRGIEVLKGIDANSPNSADAHFLAGQANEQDGDVPNALLEYKQALALNPAMREVHFRAGLLLLKKGRREEAADELRAEIALNPASTAAKYHLALALIESEKKEEALKLLLEVQRDEPNRADTYYQLGKLQLDQGDVKGAITNLETGERLDPDQYYFHYQLSLAYRRDGRASEAAREMKTYQTIKARARGRSEPTSQ